MRSVFAGLTTRGRAFMAAGAVAALLGLDLGQRALLSVGGLLIVLPLLSVLVATRTRYRIKCTRAITPTRVPAGQSASVGLQLDNVSRLPTGLLLAEDTVPYSLGARPRFILDRIEPGGTRRLNYPLQSDHRGKFPIGPLQLHVADTFGLVKVGSLATATGTLLVTPAITPLSRTSLAGTWLGEGGTRASTTAAAGEDDVVPRPYREGDELRRVHWRSTARHGELMVRREEQHWRNRVVLFLDTRGIGHAGRGPSSSFEFAVGATASIGVHLAREGIDGDFVTDSGAVTGPGSFEDALLDTLAVIGPSRGTSLAAGLAQLPRGSSGLLVAIVGHLPDEEARRLAAARRTAGPAMAMLLAVSTWAERPGSGETDSAAGILAAAGWRVVTVTADTPLPSAWESLNGPHQPTGRARPATVPALHAAGRAIARPRQAAAGQPAAKAPAGPSAGAAR